MAITAHNLNSPPAVVAEADPQDTANRMWKLWGKAGSYAIASFWGLTDPIWEDVAALIDAMSPCELCGKPGVGFYNDVFCCEAHHG